ncbi:MAG: leucine-rich repeat protein, partial [Muribaculaceae bacterium]|nr:leucine-rich repeat protein [Muribaculaceae bacterium]
DRDLFDVSSISSVYSECALIVPESSVDAYRESEYWNRFEIIVPGDVILSNYKLQMNPGDMVKVNVLNSDDMPVTWSCSNTEIAGVDSEGTIRALAVGETIVMAECNGKTAVCMISVSMDGLCEKIDGLWYRITDSSNCEVISPNNEESYEFEELSIPPTVEIFGNEYMVSAIGYAAFHSCPNLKQISIPNTVKRIGNCCFEHCFELVEVQLPLSLSSIGEYAFQGCCNLSKIDFPEQLNEIGRVAFGGCTSLEKISIPENITEIQDCTFINCSNLKEVHLPKNLEIIYSCAFESCSSLEEMIIPSTVKFMGFACFARTELKKLEMTGQSIPEVIDDIFEDGAKQYEVCDLFVPIELLDQYRNHLIFSKFSNIHGYSGIVEIAAEERTCDIYSLDGNIVVRNVVDNYGISLLRPGIYVLRYSDAQIRKIV